MQSRMRITRTITYEGTPEWIKVVLAQSMLQPGAVYHASGENCIRLEGDHSQIIEALDIVAIEDVPYGRRGE